MSLKLALLALFILAFLYVVYRGADWYFTTKEEKTKLELARERYELSRDEAVWKDNDPETFDEDEYERVRDRL